MTHLKSLPKVTLLSCIVALSACGGGGGGSASGDAGESGPEAGVSLSGLALKGVLANATVTVTSLDGSTSYGTVRTNDNGLYSLTGLNTGNSPLLVKLTTNPETLATCDSAIGCNKGSVTFGDRYAFNDPEFELTAILPGIDADESSAELMITPVTHMAARRVQAMGAETRDDIENVNTATAKILGLDGVDITRLKPSDITRQDATDDSVSQQKYGSIVAAFATLAEESESGDVAELIEQVTEDFAMDGSLKNNTNGDDIALDRVFEAAKKTVQAAAKQDIDLGSAQEQLEQEQKDAESQDPDSVAQTDSDDDGVADGEDAFPLDPQEALDTDEDGIGNNADTDDDDDGYLDADEDGYSDPLDDKSVPADLDRDFIPDHRDSDIDGDGYSNEDETVAGSEPDDNASLPDDHDGDKIPDVIDNDDDNDGVIDENDDFPFDDSETLDTDGDGIGNNADNDDDGDGIPDSDDGKPLESDGVADPQTGYLVKPSKASEVLASGLTFWFGDVDQVDEQWREMIHRARFNVEGGSFDFIDSTLIDESGWQPDPTPFSPEVLLDLTTGDWRAARNSCDLSVNAGNANVLDVTCEAEDFTIKTETADIAGQPVKEFARWLLEDSFDEEELSVLLPALQQQDDIVFPAGSQASRLTDTRVTTRYTLYCDATQQGTIDCADYQSYGSGTIADLVGGSIDFCGDRYDIDGEPGSLTGSLIRQSFHSEPEDVGQWTIETLQGTNGSQTILLFPTELCTEEDEAPIRQPGFVRYQGQIRQLDKMAVGVSETSAAEYLNGTAAEAVDSVWEALLPVDTSSPEPGDSVNELNLSYSPVATDTVYSGDASSIWVEFFGQSGVELWRAALTYSDSEFSDEHQRFDGSDWQYESWADIRLVNNSWQVFSYKDGCASEVSGNDVMVRCNGESFSHATQETSLEGVQITDYLLALVAYTYNKESEEYQEMLQWLPSSSAVFGSGDKAYKVTQTRTSDFYQLDCDVNGGSIDCGQTDNFGDFPVADIEGKTIRICDIDFTFDANNALTASGAQVGQWTLETLGTTEVVLLPAGAVGDCTFDEEQFGLVFYAGGLRGVFKQSDKSVSLGEFPDLLNDTALQKVTNLF